jgi:hypothetical protein
MKISSAARIVRVGIHLEETPMTLRERGAA